MTARPAVPTPTGARAAFVRRRRRVVLRAVAAVVLASTAVAACDGGGSAGAKNGDAPKPGSAQPSAAPEPKAPPLPRTVVPVWATPPEGKAAKDYRPEDFNPNANKGQDVPRDGALATWLVGSTLFVGRGTAVKMLDVQTGKELGSVAPPGPGMKPCAMTESVNKDGIGAIAWTVYDDGSSSGACKKLSFVDARGGGKVLRTAEFAGKKRKDGSPWYYYRSTIGFVGDDLVAALTPTSVVAFRVGDGTAAWTWENRSKDPSVFPDTPLIAPVTNETMKTGADVVAVISDAGQTAFGHDLELVTLDAAGRQIGAQPTPVEGPTPGTGAQIVSAAPLTVLLSPGIGEKHPPQLARFNRDGTPAGSFPLAAQQGPVDYLGAHSLHGHALLPYRLVGNVLYATTGRDLSKGGGSPGVVAFDLSSGQVRWEIPSADTETPILVDADEDGVLVINTSFKGLLIESYAAADGSVTPISEAPRAEFGKSVSAGSIVDVAEGRMFVTSVTPSGYGTQAFAAG